MKIGAGTNSTVRCCSCCRRRSRRREEAEYPSYLGGYGRKTRFNLKVVLDQIFGENSCQRARILTCSCVVIRNRQHMRSFLDSTCCQTETQSVRKTPSPMKISQGRFAQIALAFAALAPSSFFTQPVGAASWVTNSPMSTARDFHT